jgi:hypothetical protein
MDVPGPVFSRGDALVGPDPDETALPGRSEHSFELLPPMGILVGVTEEDLVGLCLAHALSPVLGNC